MNVVVRADSSTEIGTGHVMRCLMLADALRDQGAEILFICRDIPGNLRSELEERGYRASLLPHPTAYIEQVGPSAQQDLSVGWEADAEQTRSVLRRQKQNVDLLVIDHYALDKRWEQRLRPFAKKIMVVDDLADRPHDCDILLDQNFHANPEARYDALVPAHCRLLLGPRYALLRPEFMRAREGLRKRDGTIGRILVFFGGSDVKNQTAKALLAIQALNRPDIFVDVVVGPANPYKEQIEGLCARMPNARFYCQVQDMARLMADADLAIGAGGTATWERCYLGLPTISLAVASNQNEVLASVASAGAVRNLGWYTDVDTVALAAALREAIDSPATLKAIQEAALRITASTVRNGGNPVVQAIMEGLDAGA